VTRQSFRHSIVGSEVGRPRPLAYMRRGHTRRSRPRRTRAGVGVWGGLTLLLVLASLVVSWALA
jgi:hypothetical protein